MSESKKRSSSKRKKQEATLVGDLFKILFAVSMLVVAILIAFFVFKNVDGFSLPDLRVNITDSNEPITVTVAATESSTTEEYTVNSTVSKVIEASSDAAEVEKNIESAEASVEAEETEKKKDASEEIEELNESDENSEESKSKKKEEETVDDRDYEESDYTEEEDNPHIIPENAGNGIINDGPVVGDNRINESPGWTPDSATEISNAGPVVID
ncbi:hypothetical protein [Oribacterium sp. WCC10]|uniref:hypothetical protein n=1 Tax=Oribacterium sp. WCC10 TaxID=1855343 RepID=UPI0008E19F3A|nr:hypothetical protein [Oribacterium sp. WCC10]SFG12463.1 hypothetical protein SAMN05216356_1027 [Oribacterium sp. WCC10]